MATKSNKKTTENQIETFSKERIIKSKKYARYVDFLSAWLDEDKFYTLEEVDSLLAKLKGGK